MAWRRVAGASPPIMLCASPQERTRAATGCLLLDCRNGIFFFAALREIWLQKSCQGAAGFIIVCNTVRRATSRCCSVISKWGKRMKDEATEKGFRIFFFFFFCPRCALSKFTCNIFQSIPQVNQQVSAEYHSVYNEAFAGFCSPHLVNLI